MTGALDTTKKRKLISIEVSVSREAFRKTLTPFDLNKTQT